MNRDALDDAVLRRYLLGTLEPDARLVVEARVFTNDQIFWEHLTLVEDDLIDDYVGNDLEADDRARFEQQFLCTGERRGKLEFACALKSYAERQAGRHSPWHWLKTPVISPAWTVVAAALLLIALPAVVWRFAASERPAGEVSARLSAGLVRGARSEIPRVSIPTGSRLVRLQLDAGVHQYDTYRATLHEATGDELVSQSNLTAAPHDGGLTVMLTVPSELLPPGDYYIRLHGVSQGQAPLALGRYDFRVLRP